jgi:hypothetical protein
MSAPLCSNERLVGALGVRVFVAVAPSRCKNRHGETGAGIRGSRAALAARVIVDLLAVFETVGTLGLYVAPTRSLLRHDN